MNEESGTRAHAPVCRARRLRPWIGRLVVALGLCGSMSLAAPLGAQTRIFYIDYQYGNDGAAGTSRQTAWKHAPGMVGCAGTCAATSPMPGDRFVFKGGVIWPAAALPMDISASGMPGDAIYYGIDPGWYTGQNQGTVATEGRIVTWRSGQAFQANGTWDGGSISIGGKTFTIETVRTPHTLVLTTTAGDNASVAYSNALFRRPVFDGQHNRNAIVRVTASHLEIDGLELRGQVSVPTGGGGATVLVTASQGNVRLRNLDVHDWKRCTGTGAPSASCTGPLTDNSYSGGGIYVSMYAGLSPEGLSLERSNVGNPENGGNIGACTRGIQTLSGNHLHNCSQACLHGCRVVRDNVVTRVGNTFDGVTHTNIFYADGFDGQFAGGLTQATAYMYNNWIIDPQDAAAASLLYPNPGTSGVTGKVTYYVFNNVISCSGTGGCAAFIGLNVDPYDAPSGLQMDVYGWNNTLALLSSGVCSRATPRTYPLRVFDVRNQHCVVQSGGTAFMAGPTTQPYSAHLLLQAPDTATAQGYVAPSWWPTGKQGSTVATGANLTAFCSGELTALCYSTTLGGTRVGVQRPQSGAWDIGAFQAPVGLLPPTNLRIVE